MHNLIIAFHKIFYLGTFSISYQIEANLSIDIRSALLAKILHAVHQKNKSNQIFDLFMPPSIAKQYDAGIKNMLVKFAYFRRLNLKF